MLGKLFGLNKDPVKTLPVRRVSGIPRHPVVLGKLTDLEVLAQATGAYLHSKEIKKSQTGSTITLSTFPGVINWFGVSINTSSAKENIVCVELLLDGHPALVSTIPMSSQKRATQVLLGMASVPVIGGVRLPYAGFQPLVYDSNLVMKVTCAEDILMHYAVNHEEHRRLV